MLSNHELFENAVASVVDVASIMVAYTIGVQQSNFLLGVGYALFDALLVVWMRKPISRVVQVSFARLRGQPRIRDAYLYEPS